MNRGCETISIEIPNEFKTGVKVFGKPTYNNSVELAENEYTIIYK